MYDVYLEWGADLAAGSTGDLALVDGPTQINQRVLRRLLTNAGDYIWNPDYGGGLGMFVGSTTTPTDIEAVIRTQIALERSIPAIPTPSVSVKTSNPTGGYLIADITYADPSSGDLVNVNVQTG